MGQILILVVALLVIMLVGHGMWLVAGALLRPIFPEDEPPEHRGLLCGFCAQTLPCAVRVCPRCHQDLDTPLAQRLMALAETEALLRHFRRRRSVSKGEIQTLLARLEDELIACGQLLVEGSQDQASQPRATHDAATPAQTSKAPAMVPVAAAAPPLPAAAPASSPGEIVTAEIVDRPVSRAPRRPVVDAVTRSGDQPQLAPMRRLGDRSQHVTPPAASEVRPNPPSTNHHPTSQAPRKSLAEILAEFMEPHNIRWGEIIGGLLFIIGAAALVITQWDTLQQMRYLRFALFGLGSAAVFGVGFYSFYRWHLEATGRGLLLVATLLVPLNFLAISGLSKADPLLWTLVCEAFSLMVLGALVAAAGTVLVPRGRWLLTTAVMGTSAALLIVVRRFEFQGSLAMLTAASCLPLAFFAAGLGPYVVRLQRRRQVAPSQAIGLFNLLGAGAFGLSLAWGLTAVEAHAAAGWAMILPAFALPLALAAGLAAAAGLAVLRGMRPAKRWEPFRVAGAWVALVAAMVMLAALPLAWPYPAVFTLISLIDAIVLAVLAVRFRMPLLHAGAIVALAAAWLVGYHALAGHLAADTPLDRALLLMHSIVQASSGVALLGLAVVLAGVGELLVWRRRGAESQIYLMAAAMMAAVSLAIVTVHGWLEPTGAALAALAIYVVDAAAVVALNVRLVRRELSYLGLGLLLGGLFWVLWWSSNGTIEPAWAAAYAAAGLAMALPASRLGRAAGIAAAPSSAWLAGRGRWAMFFEAHRLPLWHMADFAAAAALTLGLATAWLDPSLLWRAWTPPLTALLLAALYLVLAWGNRSPLRAALASVVFAIGLVDVALCGLQLTLQPWTLALLAHATLAEGAAWGLKMAAGRWPAARRTVVERVFTEPLRWTALASSAAAVAAMIAAPTPLAGLAGCLAWLAVVWLSMAWRSGWPPLLAAHQLALMAAVLTGLAAWLQARGWQPPGAITPAHFYGLGLGLLGLAWVAARIAARRSGRALWLLNPGWPLPDVWLKHALVVAQGIWLAPLLIGESLREWGLAPGALTWPGLIDNPAPLGGAWLLLGLLVVVALVSLWEHWGWAELVDGLLLAGALAGLAAAPHVTHGTLGSALRWTLAVFFLLGSIAVWQRGWLQQTVGRVRARIHVGSQGSVIAQTILLAIGAAPVVLATCVVAVLYITGGTRLPTTGLFARLPLEVNYLVPVAIVVAAMVGHALHARSAGYAFAAGRVCELTIGLGYIVVSRKWGPPGIVAKAVTLFEVLAITDALWSLGWLTIRRRLDIWREGPRLDARRVLMNLQLLLGYAAMALVLLVAVLLLGLVYPHGRIWTTAAGSPLGWAAMLLITAAAVVRATQTGRTAAPHGVGLAGMAILGLLACTVERYCTGWGYRALMLGWASYALTIVAAAWWITARRGHDDALATRAFAGMAAVWVRVAGLAAVALGLKAAIFPYDASEPLWGAAAIAVASLAGATIAAWQRRSAWAFAAALGVNLAASIVVWHTQLLGRPELWWLALLQANTVASALSGLMWLAGQRRLYPLRESNPGGVPWLATQVAIPAAADLLWLGTAAMWIVGAPQQFQQAAGQLAHASGWLALLGTVAFAGWYALSFHPRAVFHAVGGLLAGLVLLVTAAVAARPGVGTFAYLHAFVAGWPAACAAALGLGCLMRAGCRVWTPGNENNDPVVSPRSPVTLGPSPGHRPKVGRGEGSNAHDWLVPDELVRGWVNLLGVIAVAAALWWSASDPQRPWWSAAALLTVGGVAAVLAVWRRESLYALVALSLVGWAILPPETLAPWMHRAAVVLVAAASLLIACGYVLPRRVKSDTWRSVLREGTTWLMAAAAIALVVTLAQEAAWFNPDGGVMRGPVIGLGIAALAALAGLCTAWAVDEDREPLGLDLHGRMLYVYAAEALLGLAGLHLYLTAPWLFGHGFFQRYGLFLVMGLAFAGAGASEWFARRGVAVLAQPLARTALLVPVLPMVLAWWIWPTPLLWFLVGGFYGVQAVLRRSAWCGLLAFAACNVGLGVLWHDLKIDIFVHPQVWLIPPALAGLVAEYLSRPRLRDDQSAALRYILLGTIYVASTADMFIAGLGHSVLLPLLLLGLSVLGILAGMALRIRSFLYLGVVFLLVVATSLLKYVTIDLRNTWVLWVCVLALGASLIALFAVFEKRRAGLVAAVERLKQWEN